MTEVVLAVDGVTKSFRVHRERTTSLKQFIIGGGRTKYDEFLALHDVSFDVREGEVFGVIGHNGSGKSTLLKCMAGILRPEAGEVRVNRRMAALLELGAGFEPELSGRDNIHLNGAILGMTRREIAERYDEIVEFSGLEQFIDTPVKTYSSGMYVRLGFAIAINVDPSLLLIDEILSVGDVTFQAKCMEKFVEFRNAGKTIVIVTHDMTSVRNLCDRALILEHGKASEVGEPGLLVEQYTESMLGSMLDEATPGAVVRRGDGRIQIESVEMLVDGEPAVTVPDGASMTLRLRYRANRPVERPVFSIRIADQHGLTVTEPNSRVGGLVPATVEGDGVVEVDVPDVTLLPGPYTLDTEISGFHRGQIHDHVQHALRFDVVAGRSHESSGLVTLRPEWRIDP